MKNNSRSIPVITQNEQTILLSIYEEIVSYFRATPEYDDTDRCAVDLNKDAQLRDIVLYHVEIFGSAHPYFSQISHLFTPQ